MEYKLDKVDTILDNLIDLAYNESQNAKSKHFFSKDIAEACGLVVSLAYGRYNKDDK